MWPPVVSSKYNQALVGNVGPAGPRPFVYKPAPAPLFSVRLVFNIVRSWSELTLSY